MSESTALIVAEADKDQLLNALVRSFLPPRGARIYEAGGGSNSWLDRTALDAPSIVVVDISPEQIERCAYADEALVGNIESWRRDDSFDLVCCVNVLEHVDNVEASLVNFAGSLRPGGICVLAGPVATSLQGWVTRLLPHALHVWYYRRVYRRPLAGQPGHAPFPVKFARGSSPGPMSEIVTREGLEVVYSCRYTGYHVRELRRRSRVLYGVFQAGCWVLRLVSLGSYDPRLTDFIVIARKPDGATAEPVTMDTDATAVAAAATSDRPAPAPVGA